MDMPSLLRVAVSQARKLCLAVCKLHRLTCTRCSSIQALVFVTIATAALIS